MRNSIPSIIFGMFIVAATVFSMAVSVTAEESNSTFDSQEADTELKAHTRAGNRPPVYFTALLTSGIFHEDGDNRLTSHDQAALLTPGLALRFGGVIGNQHFVGARFQGSWRSTEAVLDRVGGDDEWGAVSSYFLGPEYRYTMASGFYMGGSAGLSFILADNDVDSGGSPECDSVECVDTYLETTDNHGAFGVGVFVTVGYEYRVARRFAVSAEVYGGLLHGVDEYDTNMTNGTYGLAVGIGL